MKEIINPSKIELTEEEERFLEKINFDPTVFSAEYENILRSSCVAAAALAESIFSRKAVPEIRIRYFIDPELNIGTKKSREQIFEQNGTRGKAIIEHPHFLKYLQYFIFGPQLPESVKEEFVRVKSGCYMELEDISKYSRQATRQYKLDPHEVFEEFYKLSLECGFAKNEAMIVRDAVRTVKIVK